MHLVTFRPVCLIHVNTEYQKNSKPHTFTWNTVQTYLSAKFLLGVNVAGSGEGVVEQDESIRLQVEGQVRTRNEDSVEVV